MLTLWNQFDDLFADELRGRTKTARGFVPSVDIEEVADGYLLTADVPGVRPEDIDITVENGVLTVKGERRMGHREERESYRRIERSFGAFQRSFVLPKGVSADGVQAKVEDGQLFLRVPKPVASLPKKISVMTKSSAEAANHVELSQKAS